MFEGQENQSPDITGVITSELIHANGGMLIVIDSDMKMRSVNLAVLDLLGYKEHELIGKPFAEILAEEEDFPFKGETLDELIKKGATRNVEKTYLAKDGTRIPVLMSGSVIRDPDGTIQGVSCMALDLTERKKAEEPLKQSQERWRSLVANAPSLIMIVERDGTIQFLNQTMSAHNARDVIGRKIYDFLEYEDHDAMRATIGRVFRTRKPGKCEHKVTLPDAGVSWYETHIGPIHRGEEVYAAMLISMDIGERKKGEDELRRQNGFMNDVFEAIIHPFYVIDASDYSIVMANSAANPADLQGVHTCYFLIRGKSAPCEDADCVCPLKEIRKTKKPVIVEHVHRMSDGTAKVLEIHAYPILDGKGELRQVIEYFFDITQRKQMEDQLRRLSMRIITAQELERKRIATELHDGVVQTLTSIKFRMGSLREKSAGMEGKDMAIIEQAEQYLQESITELRRISRDLRPDVLDEMGLFAATENFGREFEKRTGITCGVRYGKMRERLAEDMELALYRIVQEALANVEKHSGAKTVKVSFSLSGRDIILKVHDDGKGFDLSENQNAHGKERKWGLINMRERAGFMNGKLEIRTAPGKGTTVVAEVPRTLLPRDGGGISLAESEMPALPQGLLFATGKRLREKSIDETFSSENREMVSMGRD